MKLVTKQENMAVLSYCMMDEAVEESSIVLAGLIIPLHGDGKQKVVFCFPVIFM